MKSTTVKSVLLIRQKTNSHYQRLALMTDKIKKETLFLRKHLDTNCIFQKFFHFKSTNNKTKKSQSLGLYMWEEIKFCYETRMCLSSEEALAQSGSIT